MIFLKYERQNCVHCGREFAKNDDIVVCPICGTPHHRECWADGNGCGNSSKHEQGYVYQSPEQAQDSAKTEKCSLCGNENPENALICHKCGADLTRGTQGPASKGNTMGGIPFMSFDFTPPKDPYENSTETIDDVPVSKVAKRVLVNTNYYIPRFSKLSKRKIPVSWNWASFIMPGCVWFYFRKCYIAGTLAAIFNMLVVFLFNDFLTQFYGLQLNAYADEQTMTAAINLLFSPTGLAFFGIVIGFRILMGLSGNALYKAQVMSDIRNEKQTVGGTNLIAPLIGYFVFDILTTIIISLFG